MSTAIDLNSSLKTLCLLVLSLAMSAAYGETNSNINPTLIARIEAGESISVIVEFKAVAYKAQQNGQNRRQAIASTVANILSTMPFLYPQISRYYNNFPAIAIANIKPGHLNALLKHQQLSAIQEDIKLHMHTAESIPLIGADKMQTEGISGANIAVVVLDSGLDYTQPEFGNCSSPGVPASCRVPVAFDEAIDDGQLDDDGHGTNVSAIVAATGNQLSVIGIDIFDGNSALSSDIVAGIDWAISNKETYNIRAINMSIGTGSKNTSICDRRFTNPFQTAINTAHGDGIAVVASAGNSAFIDGIELPACSANTVSVGATYDETSSGWNWGICNDTPATVDSVTCFSNSASFLSILAPGAIINAGGYQMGGTSQAAPHVAAAMAIMAGVYDNEQPADWLRRLQDTGELITDDRNGIIKPRINLYAAVISADTGNGEEIPFLPTWAFMVLAGIIIRGLIR
ncbi:MAG: S8 family serine peptidase [Gammaproteobacteria bacterium]|nr:S8 family serine peptidase [Gammaproteobacteria bacterium]MBQ0840676.1 S8 family serine peptidase [Gammaproteobacteria bacterium]